MNKFIKISVLVLVFSFLSFATFSVVSAEEIVTPEVESPVVEEVIEEVTEEVVEETPTEEVEEVTEEVTEEVVEEDSARIMMTTVIEESTATIVATKIVCNSETDLPNWGNGGADITATTADDFLASHPNCKKAPSWPFEWALNGVSNPGDNTTGTTGGSWTAFSGGATVPTGSLIWVREQVNSDYISFTGDTTDPRDDNVSAELYCHTDVLNYDNFDWINPVEANGTYHCVAFNVAKPVDVCLNMEGMQTEAPNGYKIVYQNDQSECVPVCGVHEITLYSDESNMVNGDDEAVLAYDENPSWTANIPGANWIWDTFYTQNPTQDETKFFSKTFNIVGDVESATLEIASDNTYKVSFNAFLNAFSATDSNDASDHNFTSTGQDSYNIASYLAAGSNTVSFEITNLALENGTKFNNPSGLLYKLHVVSNDCEDNANLPPVANAGADQTLTLPTNSTTLNGSLSSDADGTIVSYAWIQVSGPSVVDPANVMNYDISNLVVGTYVFQLIVTDNDGAYSTADTVTIVVNPQDGDDDSICSDGLDNDGDNLADFPEDPGCESSTDDSEDDRRILGGGGVGIRRGSVLGAQTDICDFAIDTYMRRGYNNDKEQVKILQGLLNKYVEAGLTIDGFYGPKTEKAVNAFQIKYRDTILDPWNIENPTGIFFRTSLVQAQNLECPDPELPVPENLINWSQSKNEVPPIVPVRIPLSLNYYYGI